MKSLFAYSLLVSLALSITACAGRTAAWNAAGEPPEREMTLLHEARRLAAEGDQFWENRGAEERVRDAIARWEQAVIVDPLDFESFTKASEGYAWLLRRHLGEDLEAQLDAAVLGIERAEQAMIALSPEFGERMSRGANLAEGVEVLGSEALPALYWYAVNLDFWLPHQSRWVRMRNKDNSLVVLERMLEIDETFRHGAAHRQLGLRYAREGKKGLALAGQHLDRAIEISPDYAPTRIVLAEEVAVRLKDRALFGEQIDYVLQADEAELPDHVFEARFAKDRASTLNSRINELF